MFLMHTQRCFKALQKAFFFLRSSSLGRDFYWIRYIFEVDNHLKNDRLDLDSKFHKRALNKISL